MDVALRRVDASEKLQFWDMLADYLIEDAAQHEVGYDFDPLDFPNFDKYWQEDHRSPWWILADGQPSGFALVARFSWSKLPVDQGLIEYYVEPEHRRNGIGSGAARALFRSFPGQWELQVSRRNPGGLAFWQRTVGEGGYADWQVIELPDNVLHRFVVR